MVPVPARVVIACSLILTGAWTISDLAFTVALFTIGALFIAWAAVEYEPPGDR